MELPFNGMGWWLVVAEVVDVMLINHLWMGISCRTFLIYLLQWNWYYSVKRPPSQEWLCCTTTILVGWLVGESDKNPNCDLSPINSCWAVGRLLNLNGRFERKCWMMVVVDGGEESPLHISRAVSVSHSSDQFMNARMYIYWNYSWSPVSSVHHSQPNTIQQHQPKRL